MNYFPRLCPVYSPVQSVWRTEPSHITRGSPAWYWTTLSTPTPREHFLYSRPHPSTLYHSSSPPPGPYLLSAGENGPVLCCLSNSHSRQTESPISLLGLNNVVSVVGVVCLVERLWWPQPQEEESRSSCTAVQQ